VTIPFPLILASASPRRRELLAQLGLPFTVEVALVTEDEEPSRDPRVLVAHNAALKADWVASRHPDALVLGADTTVFLDQRVINKPADLHEAKAMLRRLAGRTHTVFTGLAARRASTGLKLDDGVTSEVTFLPLTDAQIDDYVSRVDTLDKAGAYSIQDQEGLRADDAVGGTRPPGALGLPQGSASAPAPLSQGFGGQGGRAPPRVVASYIGSFSNIMGLPLNATKQILTRCGLPVSLQPIE